MPAIANPNLLKVTLNLNHTDVIWFKHRFGHGYTEHIRDAVHAYRKAHSQLDHQVEPYTVEDLE